MTKIQKPLETKLNFR